MRARGGKVRRSLAQIDKWTAVRYEAEDGEEWDLDGNGTFVDARRAFHRWLREIEKFKVALDDPFAPGAGEVLSDGMPDLDEDFSALLWRMGEAIKWGVAGADPAELEEMRAAREAAKVARPRPLTPEEIEEAIASKRHWLGCLIDRAAKDATHGEDQAPPLTTNERIALVKQLAELLGVAPEAHAATLQ